MPVILPPVLPEVPAIIRPAAHSPRPAAPHPRPNDLLEPPQIVGPVHPVLPPAAPATKSPTVERPAVTGRDGEGRDAPSTAPNRP
jgi:hypothetical protein